MFVYVAKFFDHTGRALYIKVGMTKNTPQRRNWHKDIPLSVQILFERKFRTAQNMLRFEQMVLNRLRTKFEVVKREWFIYSDDVEQAAVKLVAGAKLKQLG